MVYKTWRGPCATVSHGNTKLGAFPNLSLCPGTDCGNVPCKQQCYAMKAFRQYKDVRECWQRNSNAARTDLVGFMADVRAYLTANRPRFFRWHVAGDIPTLKYWVHMKRIARLFPDVRFLCFTKRANLGMRCKPDNLTVVFSMWPGWGDEKRIRRKGLPIAWMQDGTEDRIPDDALECPGGCDECGMCWQLPTLGRDVYFLAH